MHYRVNLAELLVFVEALEGFERQAENVAARIEAQIAQLHNTWSGEAAAAHEAHHSEWANAATDMREALTELRKAAHNAHQNYNEAVRLNIAMLTT